MTINDALPLKTAQRDAIAKLKSFWGFQSELQRKSMPFHLDSMWGDNAAYSVCDRLETEQNS